jgi:hypothetical protein
MKSQSARKIVSWGSRLFARGKKKQIIRHKTQKCDLRGRLRVTKTEKPSGQLWVSSWFNVLQAERTTENASLLAAREWPTQRLMSAAGRSFVGSRWLVSGAVCSYKVYSLRTCKQTK